MGIHQSTCKPSQLISASSLPKEDAARGRKTWQLGNHKCSSQFPHGRHGRTGRPKSQSLINTNTGRGLCKIQPAWRRDECPDLMLSFTFIALPSTTSRPAIVINNDLIITSSVLSVSACAMAVSSRGRSGRPTNSAAKGVPKFR